jgi:protein phosphatase
MIKDFGGCQSRGAREVQEDGYAFSEFAGIDGQAAGILVVVADGMGGHTAGERASRTALQNFVSAFQVSDGTISKRLTLGLNAANAGIAKELEREPTCEGMGTTLLAATVMPTGVEWVSVGDSPLYVFRGGRLTRLNADHSLRPVLEEMVEHGEIAPRVAAKSKNILRAALTGDEIALIDRSPASVPLEPADLILAASDGIHTLKDEEIARVCSESAICDASTLATNLLDAVRNAHHPKQDNTTIAVIKATL